MLDPRWVEERDKNITQKAREEVKINFIVKLLSSLASSGGVCTWPEH